MNETEYQIRKDKIALKANSVTSRLDKLNKSDTMAPEDQLLELRKDIEWLKSEMTDMEIYVNVEDFLLNGAGCKFDSKHEQ